MRLSLHLGSQIPPKKQFFSVNRHFHPNTQNIQFHIIETTAWIPTKFCTQDHQICFVGGPETRPQ